MIYIAVFSKFIEPPRDRLPKERQLFSNTDLRKLIVPIIIEQVLVMMVGMVGTMMVSYSGEAAMSGVSLSEMINGIFQYVFSAEGAQSVGMFASIGSLFPAEWNWHEFWLMTAFLSIILAFMNILPIPALDGGHALFLIVEMITGKQPSDKFMERAQMVGMLIILGLFILAMYNDLMKFVF